MNEKITHRLEKWSGRVISCFAISALIIVVTANAIVTAHVSYDGAEQVSYTFGSWQLFFLPIALIGIWAVMKWARTIREEKLFAILSIVYVMASFYLILNAGGHIRADAGLVYDAAKQFLAGNFEVLEKEQYVGTYPHQLGLVVYDMLLLRFSWNEELLYFVNSIEILVINWYGYKIADRCFHDSSVNKWTMVLEFMFLPQLFFVLFAYGTIPGFCCLIIAVYHGVCICQNEKKHGVKLILFSVLSILIRKNCSIGVLAIAIAMVLTFMKGGGQETKMAFLAVAVLLSLTAPGILKTVVSAISGIDVGAGQPSAAWIAMGTDLDNEMRAPGWYNGYNVEVYSKSGYDTKAASEMAIRQIRENVRKSIEDPARTIKFYGKKIISMWCEPMFQSVWSGPGIDGGESVSGRILKSLYSGGKVERLCLIWNKCIVMLIFCFALVFWIRRKEFRGKVQMLYLYFIGGFVFHLFWEAKSQYVYSYVFLLIPVCAYTFCDLSRWLQKKQMTFWRSTAASIPSAAGRTGSASPAPSQSAVYDILPRRI